MGFLKLGFFHLTTPPGPIRGYLELFLILATFQGVTKVSKQLPGVQGTGESLIPVPQTLGRQESPVSWSPRSRGVLDAGDSRISIGQDTGDSFFTIF